MIDGEGSEGGREGGGEGFVSRMGGAFGGVGMFDCDSFL